ncbi:hypothetical protein B0H19DRAFT_960316 [Mycena capillaripes]|nr:hypothetical protein B0H19DRAFT_960316 [Mycena capillaripes]
MGQRHQVFIVARVAAHNTTDPRYRCWHCSYVFARLPLKAARRFITLIKQKDNAELVTEELRTIQGKYGAENTEPVMPEVPCPYTTFLLASAWCVDLEVGTDSFAIGVSFSNAVLDAKMGSTEGDNNDGITVFDITDPMNPSYCFVSIFGLESAASIPLTAEQYCRAYYPVPTEQEKQREGAKEAEEDVKEKIASLCNERLMKLDVLVETWPREYALKTAFKAPTDDGTEAASLASPPISIPSLADLSLKPAVEYGIQTGETEELEALVWHPGKADGMKPILQRQNPFPDSGMSLLAKVIEHETGSTKTLDISGFSLSATQIVSLLTASSMENVEVLKLSHNPNITVDALRQILSLDHKLRRIMLLDTSITDEQLKELLIQNPKLFHSIEELVHPALLSFQDPARYPNGFAYIGLHGSQTTCSPSLAVFTPATVVNSLIDFLSCVADADQYDSYGLFGSSLVPQIALASGIRGVGTPWRERHVHCFPAFTNNPFNGQGWLFVSTWDSYRTDENRYGFVSIVDAKVEAPKAKICGLKTFLEEMALEGRPAASEDAVNKLEKIFADLDSKKGAKLWTEGEFLLFMKKFAMYNSRRYW